MADKPNSLASYSPPTSGVSGLSVSRNGRAFTLKWSVPSSQTKKSNHQATKRIVTCEAWAYQNDSIKKVYSNKWSKAVSSKTATVTLPKMYDGLSYINFSVALSNKYGTGIEKTVTYSLNAPAAITIASPTNDSNKVSCVFTAAASNATNKPRISSAQTVTRTVYKNGASSKTVTKYTHFGSEAAGSWTYTNNDADAQSFQKQDDYILYEFSASATGTRYKTTTKSKSIRFRLARKTSINGTITANSDVISVPVKSVSASDTMQLQVGYSTSSLVESWSDVGTAASGNSNCLVVPRSAITEQPNTHVFFRVKTSYMGVAAYDQYSGQVECKSLYNAQSSAPTDLVKIFDDKFEHGKDSITVKLGWKYNANYNATELSWSKDQGAWRSTKEPETEQMPDIDWNDGAITGYTGTTSIKVVGLDEATRYWFRARRYNTADDERRTSWSNSSNTSTGATDAGVVLIADGNAAAGEDYAVSWAVGGDAPQTEFILTANGRTFRGDGTANSYVIPADAVGNGDVLSMSIVVRNGSAVDFKDSKSVPIAARPQATITPPSEITALPFDVGVAVNVPCRLSVMLVSTGATSARPDGYSFQQYDGDVVWSGEIDVTGNATVQIGADADLIAAAGYRIIATPFASGLQGSTTESETVYVDWLHKAEPATADIVTDVDALAASITVHAPANHVAGDTYSIYRNTINGVRLVAESLADGAIVIDGFAPFSFNGYCEYIIETVTKDGDRDWTFESYELAHDALVICWNESKIDLPYDISLTDSWAKDSETVTYLDGATAGFWNDGAPMRQSLSTSLLKFDDEERISLVTELAKHAGSVFVRTPAGHAYEADLQIDSVAYSAEDAVVACGMSAVEVSNGGFMAMPPAIDEDTDGDENA